MILFCLGVNKQADFQSLLTLYGREILHHAGLHDVRRPIQVAFILGIAVVSLLGVVLSLWLVRRWSWPCRFAAVGLGIQAAFLVVRATSFHNVDHLLGWRLGGLKINLLLESIGLVVMLWAAIAAGNRKVVSRQSSVGSWQLAMKRESQVESQVLCAWFFVNEERRTKNSTDDC